MSQFGQLCAGASKNFGPPRTAVTPWKLCLGELLKPTLGLHGDVMVSHLCAQVRLR